MTASRGQFGRLSRCAAALAAVSVIGGCALPRSAPYDRDFAKASSQQSIQLVDATMQDAVASRVRTAVDFDQSWQAKPASTIGVIGDGDVLSVTFYERDGLNLFAVGADGNAQFSGLTVDREGFIRIPYVGQVHVAGLTTSEAHDAIIACLGRLTLSTDLTVAITQQQSQLVSVQGDVSKPGVVPIGPQSSRLLEVLSIAAPTPMNMDVATVTIHRDGRSAMMPLSDLYRQPQDNIAVRGGDLIVVRSTPGWVNVLGAAGLQGRVRVTRDNYSVVDAVGDARGLDESAANPAGVYLMQASQATGPASRPRIYHFDFRNPAQIGVAAAFAVHDGDAVLIADAQFNQYRKVLSAFTGVVASGRSASYLIP